MSIEDFIITLFVKVNQEIGDQNKRSDAKLYPDEIVTLALLYVIKGKSQSYFYRWISLNYKHFFPNLPERTRLFRLFTAYRHNIGKFLAKKSLMGKEKPDGSY